MDKLGPICRSVDDCALVMSSIYGPDGKDLSVRDAAFNWDAHFDWRSLRIGYCPTAFEIPKPLLETMPTGLSSEKQKKWREDYALRRASRERTRYDRTFDLATLDQLKSMGVKLIPVELPKLPYGAMANLLSAEAAAAFDELTMTGRDKLLTAQGPEDWPNVFRTARFYPAVEYIQANRARSIAIQQMAAIFKIVDIIVIPSDGEQLTITNLTGHPAVIQPNGIRENDAPNLPPSIPAMKTTSAVPGRRSALLFSATCIRMQSSAPSRAPTSTLPISPRCIPIYPASASDGSERRAAHSSLLVD